MSKLRFPPVDTMTDPLSDTAQSWWRRIPSRRDLTQGRFMKQRRHPWRTVGVLVGAASAGVAAGAAIFYFADPVRGQRRRDLARQRMSIEMHKLTSQFNAAMSEKPYVHIEEVVTEGSQAL